MKSGRVEHGRALVLPEPPCQDHTRATFDANLRIPGSGSEHVRQCLASRRVRISLERVLGPFPEGSMASHPHHASQQRVGDEYMLQAYTTRVFN